MFKKGQAYTIKEINQIKTKTYNNIYANLEKAKKTEDYTNQKKYIIENEVFIYSGNKEEKDHALGD